MPPEAIIFPIFLSLTLAVGIAHVVESRHRITKAVREADDFLFSTNKGKHYRAEYQGGRIKPWKLIDLTRNIEVRGHYKWANEIQKAWEAYLIKTYGSIVPDNFNDVSKLREDTKPKTYSPSWD